MRQEPYPDCPAEEIVREVAAEVAPAHIARRTLQHVAQCDHCGPLFKSYREAFSEELSPEIAALVEKTPSATAKAQQKLAREIARSINTQAAAPQPTLWERVRAWLATTGGRVAAGATAAVMLVFGFVEGPVLYGRWQLSKADEFLTMASSMRATTELRELGQPNKPDEIVVKGSDDLTDWRIKPTQLIEAEALVNRYCPKRPDAKCLELKARISRLDGGPNSAMSAAADFEKAVALRPDDPRLKIELAISQFDVSKANASRVNKRPVLTSTIDLLNDALRNPKLNVEERKVATFNLAVAYQESELLPSAIAAWNDYLALDPSGPWKQEAEDRLRKAKEDVQAKRSISYRAPKDFLQHVSGASMPQGLEQYLEIAVRDWLPAANADPASDAAQAVHELGALLLQQHSDPWMKDFVSASAKNSVPGVKLLAEAFNDNINDFHTQALSKAEKAAEMFRQQGNLPGMLRARFEEVYALQRRLEGGACLAKAQDLSRLLAKTHYGWLIVQSELEQATCAGMISDISAEKSLKASANLNKQFQYPELGLRIIGFEAGIEKNNNNYDAAWAKAVDGLHAYWQGSYSWERLYQFYSVMWQCAKGNHARHAARALLLQSIRIFEESAPADSNLQAMLYLTLANNLREQNEQALARSETNKALSLLNATTDPTAREYALTTQIEFAGLELRLGKPERALAAIEPVRNLLATGNVPIKRDFYGTLAKTYWKMGRLQDATSAYRSAIDVIENSVHAMPEDMQVDWLATAREIYAATTQVLLAQADDVGALKIWERYKLLTFAPQEFSTATVPGLAGTTLSVREPHLIYASFDDHLQIWLLGTSGIMTRSVAIRGAELQQLTGELADATKNPNSSPEVAGALGRNLYSYLIEPVVGSLRFGESLVVELDQTAQPLSKPIMELLRNSQDRYFSDDHTISYSPGILVEERLRDPRPLGRQEPVLFVSGSGYLPGSEKELNTVMDVFPKTMVLAKEEATKLAIKKALPNRAALFYSGHARDGARGMFLAVNSRTSMDAGDFQPKELSTVRLVVLSACSSGVAPSGVLEKNNLVHGFLAGGVPSVVASSWSVDSKTTADFMHKFYDSLAKGESVAQSLDDARKEIRANKPHPYFWAAFSLTGRVS